MEDMEDKETQADVEKRLKYLADTKRFEDATKQRNNPPQTRCDSSFFAFGDFQRHYSKHQKHQEYQTNLLRKA